MQISGSGTSPLLNLSVTPQSLKAMPLRNGQTLSATVLHSDTPGKLNLDINGKLLQVTSSLRLTEGMTLQLRVEKNSEQALLHLDDKAVRQLVHSQGLRHSLPLQEPLKPLFERLQQLVQPQGARAATLKTPLPSASSQASTTPDRAQPSAQARTEVPTSGDTPRATPAAATPRQVQLAISRLLNILPSIGQISRAPGLQQAIARSGLFLESSLLQGQAASSDKDVKTALLRLARTIRQNLGDGGDAKPGQGAVGREALQTLLRQVDSGVARLQLHQLNALSSQQTQGDERQLLTLELPLWQPQEKNLEFLHLKIQREKGQAGAGAGSCWSVTLHLSPAGFGDIHAVVSLAGGKVSTTFWCEQEQTGELFREELETLQQRLSEQGLEVGRFSALTGSPPADVSASEAIASNTLIDTRA